MSKLLHFWHFYFATALGTGLSPWAPGTVGSAFAVVLYWLFFPASSWYSLLIILVLLALGTWSSFAMAESCDNDDPSMVVIDEVVGQCLTFLFLPFFDWKVVLAGFLLFRFFDILKPWPVGRLERLPGGYGIMFDDVAAGIMANLVLQILFRFVL